MATQKEIDYFLDVYGSDWVDYPEFTHQKIIEKYGVWVEGNEDVGDGYWTEANFMFDLQVALKYTLLVYHPESPFSKVSDWTFRKESVVEIAEVPASQRDRLFTNENPMVGDMATRILRETSDFDYELMVSACDAIATLLEIVRKPIDTAMQDDKERNAAKAKRECYDDARYLMQESKKMMAKARGESPDVADHVNTSVFKGGLAEKLAEKKKKS